MASSDLAVSAARLAHDLRRLFGCAQSKPSIDVTRAKYESAASLAINSIGSSGQEQLSPEETGVGCVQQVTMLLQSLQAFSVVVSSRVKILTGSA
jgi:hypothetical protein